MFSANASSPIQPTSLWGDVVAHPFARLGWWLAACMSAVVLVVSGAEWMTGNAGRWNHHWIKGIAGAVAVLARCYLAILERTLVGFEEKLWQQNDLESGGSIWEALISSIAGFALAFAPAIAWHSYAASAGLPAHPILEILIVAGGMYFSVAMLSVAFHGGVTALGPITVFTALARADRRFQIAAAALAILPLMLIQWGRVAASSSMVLSVLVGICAAYLLIIHARLLAVLYLKNSSRIGWE